MYRFLIENVKKFLVKKDISKFDKCIQEKDDENNKMESINNIKENSFNNKSLIIVKNDDFIEIDIEECLFKNLLDSHNEEIDKYNIPMKNYIYDGILSIDTKLSKQKIFITNNENYKYFITIDDNIVLISQYFGQNQEIYETDLNINFLTKEFNISKLIHDSNYSTKEVKSYPVAENIPRELCLEKNEAFNLVIKLLNNLSQIEKINNILNLEKIYEFFDLEEEKYFHPIISDDVITLSSSFKNNIDDTKFENLNIILNETREIVGEIFFNYYNEGFSYGGNVGYSIKKKYQNNHYATRALDLLKKVLINNNFTGDKDLYISTVVDNTKSQKVIKNNDGELVYKGRVPGTDSINFIDGVEKVFVYRININK